MQLRFVFSNEKGTTNFTSFCKQTNTFQFWIKYSTKPNQEEIFPNCQWLDNLKIFFFSLYILLSWIPRWPLCKLLKSTSFLHMEAQPYFNKVELQCSLEMKEPELVRHLNSFSHFPVILYMFNNTAKQNMVKLNTLLIHFK